MHKFATLKLTNPALLQQPSIETHVFMLPVEFRFFHSLRIFMYIFEKSVSPT